MKDLIFLVAIFASFIYFAFISILGLDPEESSAGMTYKVYCIIVFLLSIITYISSFSIKHINSKQFVSFLIIFIYIVTGLLSGYANDKSWLVLVAFCLPATCIAVYYAERKTIYKMVKWLDLLIVFFAVSLFFSVTKLYVNILDGTSYYSQQLSYLAAYCFIIDLFLIVFGSNFQRFCFFETKPYKIISLLLLPYFLLIQFFAGGRGAVGTLVAGIIAIIYIYKKNYSHIKLNYTRAVLILVGCASLLSLWAPRDTSEMFTENIGRAFSFFSSDMDMYDKTSGRDEVYRAALDMISEKPIIGYGLFGYKDKPYSFSKIGYPHNIFLEVLLQGGMCFLLIFVLYLFSTVQKLLKIVKNKYQSVVALFFVFSMTLLLFSGSYVENPFFWFSFIFIFNFRVNNKIIRHEPYE